MTDLEFLKGCGIAPDLPDAELVLKLRDCFAATISIFPPEAITPVMTCKELMNGWKPKGWFHDGLDSMDYVMALEEKLGIPIADEYAEALIAPDVNPERTVKALILNCLEVLEAQKQGISVPPRALTFWTGKRCYHGMAWFLPVFGALTLVTALAGIPWLVKINSLYPFCISIESLFVIWLGIRLWKWHRVTLDRLQLDKKYRAVLYIPGQSGVWLEKPDFANYGGWVFADAVTAEKRAKAVAVFLKLPLETPLNRDIVRFRGWNPPNWCVIDTELFFRELSAFCERCKTVGYPCEVDALLNRIRNTDSFNTLANAVAGLEARLSKDTLTSDRKALLANSERTAARLAAYYKFLQDCGVRSGTRDALLADKLRKLWAAGSRRLTEDDVTADMRLGELASQWFPPQDLDSDIHEERVLAWGIALGEYYDDLANLNFLPDWTLGELVRKVSDAVETKNGQESGKKLNSWQEHTVTLFGVLVLSFLFTGFYSLQSDTAWRWRVWALMFGFFCIAWLVIVLWSKHKSQETKP